MPRTRQTDRRVTKDATVAGSEYNRKTVEVSTTNGAEGNYPSVDEDVRRNQEGKETEETILVGDGQNSGMKGILSCANILKKLKMSVSQSAATERSCDTCGILGDASLCVRILGA